MLQCSVKDLCLPVRLQMIGQAFAKSCLFVFEESSPKFTKENWVMITYNGRRHPVQLENLLNEHIYNLGG